ncbi:hypothetical protein A225_R1p0610 (plasmid) [Klebsiella michiganensis E718]|nr:hypothetical protein A225_R1p0610 [Klebsiella michiganensis E718]
MKQMTVSLRWSKMSGQTITLKAGKKLMFWRLYLFLQQ